jgi:acetolactate synthase-1/2/3 large subunit
MGGKCEIPALSESVIIRYNSVEASLVGPNMESESYNLQGAGQWARTGGEWFLRILQSLGIKYIFGTTGGGMPDIQDAMTCVKPPIWIQGLHEFNSICAAIGYALASEEASVCLVDRIVGTANAMGAFYAAYENYAPVVVFASQNLPGLSSGHLPDGRPRNAVHYHSWQSLLPTPWTKWRCEISNLDLLPQSIIKAFMLSMTEPRGPTYVTLRQDLMAARVNPRPWRFKISNFSASSFEADGESVETAAKLLLEAENPIVLATSMGRNTSAVPRLVELAEAIGCGVVDGRNFLNFPMDHLLFLGFHRRARAESPFLKEADVLLCIETYYEYPFAPPEDCKVIAVGPDLAMLQGGSGGDYGGNLYPADARLAGDSALILTRLTKAVKRGMTPSLRRVAEERRIRNREKHEKLISEWKKEADKHLDDEPISTYRVALELNKVWDENTIWVNQTITMSSQLLQGIFLTKPGTYFTNPSGHLGPAASMGYGIALARPEEKVVVTTGDGDFVFGNPASTLWTCSHYHIPVLYLIFNNACWGIEWPFIVDATLKLAASSRNYECVDIDEPRIDFANLAEAFNVRSETLSHPWDAEEKLKWAFDVVSKGEPALIDIHLEKYTEGKSSYTYSFQRQIKEPQMVNVRHR